MSQKTTILLVLILLLGAGLRLAALDSAPPGLTHDEADHGLDAAGVLEGVTPIYFTVGYGREPLYDYTTALTMLVVGQNFMASRLTAVGFGLGLMALVFFLVRRWSGDDRIALATVAGIAISFWTVSTSRQALRSVTLPVMYTAAALAWISALSVEKKPPTVRVKRWSLVILAGVLLGLTFYTYLAARVMWAVFPALIIGLAVLHPGSMRRVWPALGVKALTAALVGAPLAIYLLNNPEAEVRVGQLSGPIDAFFAGNPGPLLENVIAGLGMISFRGDDLWLYNIPGRPLLNPALSVLFFIGVAVALAQMVTPYARADREPRPHFRRVSLHLFMFLTMGAGLVPALVTGVGASNVRVIGMQPALYYFPAVGALALALWAQRQIGERGPQTIWVGFGLLIIVSAVTEGYAYFSTWANARDVRVAYHTTLVETLNYLDANPDIGPDVAISTITPGRFHDPAVARMALIRDDLRLRWFDGRTAVVYPQGDGVTLIAPEIAAVTPPGSPAGYQQLRLRPGDFNRTVDFFTLGEIPEPTGQTVVQAGDLLTLVGWQITPQQAAPGETITVVTWWRAGERQILDLVLFTHAIDANGELIAQADELGAPPSSWYAGDWIVQTHHLTLPADAPSGTLTLYVGAYTRPEVIRLPLSGEDGHPLGDAYPIGSIEVQP